MKRELTADVETILSRLKARNEQLDRQIEVALKPWGLSREVFAQLPRYLVGHDQRRLEQLEQEHRRPIVSSETTWEELCRPSIDQLSNQQHVRLLRA